MPSPMSDLVVKILTEANACLCSGIAGSLPTDEPLLVDNMREARAKIEAVLDVIRVGSAEGWK